MFEEELSINPAKLYRSLWEVVFRRGGADLIIGNNVKVISGANSGAALLNVDRRSVPCDIILLTSGSWSRELCGQLGYDPQILPARGLAVLFDTGGKEIISTPAILEDYGIGLAQHNTTTLRLTGFFEMVGFREDFADARKKWLLDRFRRHVVKSDEVRIVEQGVGFRPCSPDQMPIIGLVPGYRNVYIASGNCRLGVTLAPATADVLRSMIAGTDSTLVGLDSSPPSWYDPNRFAS